MLRLILSAAITLTVLPAVAAEKTFDFQKFALDQSPTGFVSTVSAQGKPGDWRIVDDEVPTLLAPLSPNASSSNKRRVLAQVSRDQTDEHFPLLIYTNEVFGDFTLTTRFKCVAGEKEQMAGIAFRILDEKNYYVVRASALGNTFRFYKFVEGQRSQPIGPEIKIPSGTWHEMTVSCKGNEIRCTLNGTEIPMLTDNSFSAGKIGFWTKSDSVSHFTDTRITYTPREPLAQKVIRDMMEKFPKVLGLTLYAKKDNDIQVIASNDEKNIGAKGGEAEEDVINNERVYHTKGKDTITVILPVRDNNGEAIAALHVKLKSFPGQTEGNALARALPINKNISARIQTAKGLYE